MADPGKGRDLTPFLTEVLSLNSYPVGMADPTNSPSLTYTPPTPPCHPPHQQHHPSLHSGCNAHRPLTILSCTPLRPAASGPVLCHLEIQAWLLCPLPPEEGAVAGWT